ncbi:GntR family transcriptional regulator [Acetonema longum]|uniref:Transcriptional regulator, GntR family protein n=1 Tax=Acetonema longum DSM 6540 TaxID=1009370 RepID=F7NG73_9FIRM|nr:GntR family transcriptional regulator [Acetonema longum]EGO64991.1 transcriptional regulator, GntR family protein [Acetonema longum DSM 6540]
MKEMKFTSAGEDSLSNKVFKFVKTQIINGGYGPGEILLEGKLADELGVSRTPVREAIRLLEMEGLVETAPKKGTVVLGISSKDVQDIFAIRQLLEGLAARLAAERLTGDELKELQKTYDLMEFFTQKEDPEELTDLDNRFHHIIYQASGSRILNLTLHNLHYYVQLARLDSLRSPQRPPHVIDEHRAILDALAKRNPDQAEQAMVHHVKMAYRNISSHFPETNR